MTRITSAQAISSGVTGVSASGATPADSASTPGTAANTRSAVGLRRRLRAHTKSSRTWVPRAGCRCRRSGHARGRATSSSTILLGPSGGTPSPAGGSTMQITLYRRTYPVPGAPVAWSFVPHSPGQRHTFTAGGKVYEAERGEVPVVVPDGAKLDT